MTVSPKIHISKVYNFTSSAVYQKFKNFFIALLIFSFLVAISLPFTNFASETSKHFEKIRLENLHGLPEVKLSNSASISSPRNERCVHWDCFNIYRCGHTGHDRISVYVYPLKKYVDESGVPATEFISKQFYLLLKAVINSKYYTANPEEACLFLPSIDTLNQDKIRLNLTSKALNMLPFWNNGENHLIFNMIAGASPDFSNVIELNIGNAVVAGANFDTYTYRDKFDVAVPLFSPVARLAEAATATALGQRSWLVVSSQLNLDPYFADELQNLSRYFPAELLILNSCHPANYTTRCDPRSGSKYSFPQILRKSAFCLVFRGERMGQPTLLESMAAGCVPVIVADGVVMPFGDVIDWRHSAVFVMESRLDGLMEILGAISEKRVKEMRESVRFLYGRYFESIEKIALTTLDVLQDRVYPHKARTYNDWNLRTDEINRNPLFFPSTAPKNTGFTAVILTYDRVESLYTLIERLSKVPSLMKVVVVWNNQKKDPPPLSEFPKVRKPINVIKTKANKLSNRFFPYKEIETEAVLHIDDDIVMLTSDEVEFAFEVWREFPDRIVGFPSRTHIWDNVTNSWKYESEWTNEISMVLTGAAFLHKYWSFLYTYSMPSGVKDWADENMNCEDIAMNFLVANVTDKPPIKVTPRKKFKCPECINNEMLSADLGHMVARSQCVDRFTRVFGRMPLKSVEFRADPVLFKDPFPEKLKRFNDIGSL